MAVLTRLALAAFLAVLTPAIATCSRIVLVEAGSEAGSLKQDLDTVCYFYGTDLTVAIAGKNVQDVIQAVANQSTSGVIVNAAALHSIDRKRFLAALHRPAGYLPLMVAGINESTDKDSLSLWSEGAVTGAGPLVSLSASGLWRMAQMNSFTRELGDEVFPMPKAPVRTLVLSGSGRSNVIAAARDGDKDFPVLVNTGDEGRLSLFLPAWPAESDKGDVIETLVPLSPLFMFVRYASGSGAWHMSEHFANLTVDDAWLTEPYGNLSYSGLLHEMNTHNFHTTIAFIPWNFDRSKADVVSIIHNNPNRYSIAVHGDNHDHDEFNAYTNHSLREQIVALKQAVARMDKLTQSTGLPYDKVMVWPHEIMPPAPTLLALKEQNFLASVNADIRPLGSAPADSLKSMLWTGRLLYVNFPAVQRMSTAMGSLKARLALNAFLENPILLYAHQSFFASGSGAFDDLADFINRLQPDIHWTSLGEMARHLYVLSRRDDGNYNIRSFSSDIVLENPEAHAVTYFIEKDETFSPSISTVRVNGQTHEYERAGGCLRMKVNLGPEQSAHVVISYADAHADLQAGVEKSSWRVNVLRRLSDARDLWLSRTGIGSRLTDVYYRYLFHAERKLESVYALAGISIILAGGFLFGWGRLRRKRPGMAGH